MDNDTLLRRCAFLHLEPVEQLTFDPIRLLSGEDGLVPQTEWRALAPHLSTPVAVDESELAALGHISENAWKPRAALEASVGAESLTSLCKKGLVIEKDGTTSLSDDALRNTYWHAGSVIAHAFSRWSHTDSEAARRAVRFDGVEEMVERCGSPPPHFHRREDAIAHVALDEPRRTELDDLLERRATCRNFDLAKPLPLADLSALLKRVFGVHGMEELAPGAVALKKNHPSGGDLHPVEAYLIVQCVNDLAPGYTTTTSSHTHWIACANSMRRWRANSP